MNNSKAFKGSCKCFKGSLLSDLFRSLTTGVQTIKPALEKFSNGLLNLLSIKIKAPRWKAEAIDCSGE